MEKIYLWDESEYEYGSDINFAPFLVPYLHDDEKKHPCMMVVPGGAYMGVSHTEGKIVADSFFNEDYNCFVLTYTTNPFLYKPLGNQSLQDISRAIRLLRRRAGKYGIDSCKIAICGFSAGGHLCGSISCHFKDIEDNNLEYSEYSNRPDGVILSYPVISFGEYGHRETREAILGKNPIEKDIEYYSLERQVHSDNPPTFLWHTATDDGVPIENSFMYAKALKDNGVKFAQHIFAEGPHGLSLATEDWLNGRFGDAYTMEQIYSFIDAVSSGRIEVSDGIREWIERDYGKEKTKNFVWKTEDEKEYLAPILRNVSSWSDLAKSFLKNLFED